MKYKQLRFNLLISLSVIFVSLLVIFEYYTYHVRTRMLHQISNEKLFILTKTMRNIEKSQQQIYTVRTKRIQENLPLMQALARSDSKIIRPLIHRSIKFYYEETPSLEHIHFYNSNAVIIADNESSHVKDSDYINTQDNLVLQEAMKTNLPQSGYVANQKGIFYYSFVFPLSLNAKVTTYVEYATKSDNIFKLTSKAGHYKYAIYIQNKSSKKRELGNLVVTNSSLFKKLNLTQAYVDKYANQNKIISLDEKYYILHQYDIETKFQKEFAQVIMAIDTTKFVNNNKNVVLTTFELSIIVFILILSLIYFILTKLINKLTKEEKELTHHKNQMQIVINNSDNLIVLLEADIVTLANNTLFSYAGVHNLASFVETYANISKLFVQEKTTFVSKSATTNSQWIDEILQLDEEDRVVALNHKEFGINYFSVKINIHEDDYNSRIVIFSNISSIYRKSIKDEYMAYHDNLTGIYNRQYFNQAIAENLFLVNQQKVQSSLLMLDLDFFKKVNDTYGHQIGDDVLITFSRVILESIREDDIFARWGGEEFVLLLRNLNEETAFKVAQNLREKISKIDFKEAGQITCSIGLSQSQMGDTPDAWMARVDKALYRAKDNGRNRVEIAI